MAHRGRMGQGVWPVTKSPIYVPAEGNSNATIVIVGEAPGAHEEKQKAPFVGYSGQLLRNTLANIGILPTSVYITNVCHYRPPGNQISRWFRKVGKIHVPNKLVVEGIVELYRDLAKIRPTVVVPLGNTALWALCGVRSVTKRRGSIMPISWDLKRARIFQEAGALNNEFLDDVAAVQGTKVIPTFHPAYVLRQMEHLAVFQTDLERIRDDSLFPELRLPQREFFIDPPEAEREQLIESLLDSDRISFDIECIGYRLYCVGFASDPSWGLVLTAEHPGNIRAITELLASSVPKIAQNGLFDVTFLAMQNGISVAEFAHDTMVAQHAAYPSLPKGLDFLCSVYTREPYYKDEGKNWDPRDAADVQRFLEYNGKDVCATLEIAIKQEENELKDPGYKITFDRVMSQTPVYAEQTIKGIKVDLPLMFELRTQKERVWKELQEELDKTTMGHLASMLQAAEKKGLAKVANNLKVFISSRINEMGTLKGAINVNSSKILQQLCYDILGLKVKKNRATGRPTTDEDALKELYAESGNPILLTVISIRQIRKAVSSYLSLQTDADGTCHFSVNPVKAKTGRSSYGKTITGQGNNKQTIPHDLRKIYVPDTAGYKFAYLDLDQAEARIVAYKGGITRMIEAFEQKQVKYTASDVHSLTAHNLLGVAYEELKEYPHRYLGKRCNHAFNYEMGPEKFYKIVARDAAETGVSLTRKQAKQLRELHLRAYPELQTYWEDIRGMLRANRTIINPMGRKRVFLGRLDNDTFREAFSHYAQSTVADVLRTGMVNVHNGPVMEFRNDGFTYTRVVLEGHDALLLQYPEEREEEFLRAAVRCMLIPFLINTHEITIPVGIEAGYNYGSQDDDNPQGLTKYVLQGA